ncbi:MAG: sulfatase-like hydrolase/transferase [Elusimicrobiaceae bacterium]|nr:sulfatase-like hydrolase/transferase [Elusimicrobiaceae bacterium]
MKNETINICFATDNNYAKYMGLALMSILKSANKEDKLHFFILDNQIKQEEKDKIATLKKIKDFEITYISINDEIFKNCHANQKGLSLTAFARFLVPWLIEVDKLLYLDCDIFVRKSLAPLFSSLKTDLFKLKIKIISIYYLAFFLLLQFSRIAILKISSNYFQELTGKDILLSFLNGLRFDFYILALLLFPLFILFMLPYKKKFIINIFHIVFSILFLCCTLFCVGDIIFFMFFNNHIGIEVLTSFTHFGLFTQMAFQNYFYITIPLILFFALYLFFVFKKTNSYELIVKNNKKYIIKSFVFILCLILLMPLMLRGKLEIRGKNLGTMDAQILGKDRTADLILNGPFNTYEAVRKSSKRKLYFKEEDLKIKQNPSYNIPDENYPFEKKFVNFNSKNDNYNFVLLVLESFDPLLLEQYPQDIPNIIKIKEDGLFFSNFYSSGMRSLLGITGTIFSLPYVWGMPNMTNGLGAKNLSRLAHYFNNKGYETFSFTTDIASADKANEMAKYQGFNQFYAKEDIPVKKKYPLFNKGFDWEGFEFILDKINNTNKNFFVYFFTSSMHSPYNILLSEEHKKYPQDTQEHQFVNRAIYVDSSIGNFFEKAKKELWFDKTIFFILPDHRAVLANKNNSNINLTDQKFKSFLIIYGKPIKAGINDKIATQEDILPTLLDLLNTEESFASSGESLFDKNRSDTKFIYEENKNTIHIISPTIKEHFSEETLTDFDKLTPLEKEALKYNEAIYNALKNNSWKKK